MLGNKPFEILGLRKCQQLLFQKELKYKYFSYLLPNGDTLNMHTFPLEHSHFKSVGHVQRVVVNLERYTVPVNSLDRRGFLYLDYFHQQYDINNMK
jgi:hypothetical protein